MSLILVALALGLGGAWVVSWLLLPLWQAAGRARPGLRAWTPAVAAVPWLVGAGLVLGALLPGDPHVGEFWTCHCAGSAWAHLCPTHPAQAAPLVLPALAVLAALLPGRLQLLARWVREPLGQGGTGPRVIALDRPVALLRGWLRPTLVVDQGLWAALAPRERVAVLAHEQGHIDRRDPLTLHLIRGLLVLAPSRIADGLVRDWLVHAELSADAAAARRLGGLSVAEALLRCARLAAVPKGVLGWTGGALEQRVEALLSGPGHPARPDLRLAHLACLAAAAGGCVAASPWVHHQLEHLLNLSL